ncbi:aminotransferase class I/II-fold pyridoxal phosphate-dependent enzyme [Colwellia sp. 6_MG-2023]|uniref:aminotransferase class I/II-fold pyridoxal phosphate-dependent enzyme n=1 Tax=Colwellia sp. 6_MG-2023 TaxID=3062676 RepID=UPI0026E2C350|nr:aminotransferase class I/II-fold pyridoxal phosphate-dependent enzyme [Colwellia sp. 6_MG-2023]MDO6487972.1 aminotransferase class I/II-fold pyridoxal phosphate-dependent enzyme [Colwellia sp. 6_MG-2023]
MFPGARIGFMALDKTLSDAVVNYKTIINYKVNVPMQDAIARWMKAGDFERYLRKTTKVYNQRRDFMVQQLVHYQNLGKVKSFTVPDGGMAMWVEVNQSAQQLAKLALNNSIFLQQEGQFLVDKTQSQDRFIRLGFAGMNIENIELGLKCIFNLIKEQ